MKKDAVFNLFGAFQEGVLLYSGIRFGILQRLGQSAATITELVEVSSIPEERLIRLLRGLCACRIITADEDGLFTLTPTGEAYLECEQSILFQGSIAMKSWTFLDRFFETGQNPFVLANGDPVFDAIQKDEWLGEIFGHSWASRTREFSAGIASLPLFKKVRTVIDIGGAEGQLLIDVLATHPHLTGTVFDLPYCRTQFESARAMFPCAERVAFCEGDFFGPIPAGADIYLMKWIIHDWDDENAVRILENCRQAMGTESHLLILDRVVPEEFLASIPFAQADLNMAAVNLGKERTRTEFARILDQAGLRLSAVHDFPNDLGLKIVEAVSRGQN